MRTNAAPHPDCDEVITAHELDRVLPTTDYLVLACPLTPATQGMLDRRRLGLLPRGAGVVNIGRGALLDQDALCDLLDSGHLSGAVLDVFTPEPLPEGHRMWTTPNVIISPHTSVDEPILVQCAQPRHLLREPARAARRPADAHRVRHHARLLTGVRMTQRREGYGATPGA